MEAFTFMSSDANVALIQGAYADFQTGNISSLLERLSDDVSWYNPSPPEIVPQGGLRKGKAAVADFFVILARDLEFTKFDPHQFIASDDSVVARVSYAATLRSTGVNIAEESAMFFRLRDGKIAEFREYVDTRPVVAAYAAQPAGARR